MDAICDPLNHNLFYKTYFLISKVKTSKVKLAFDCKCGTTTTDFSKMLSIQLNKNNNMDNFVIINYSTQLFRLIAQHHYHNAYGTENVPNMTKDFYGKLTKNNQTWIDQIKIIDTNVTNYIDSGKSTNNKTKPTLNSFIELPIIHPCLLYYHGDDDVVKLYFEHKNEENEKELWDTLMNENKEKKTRKDAYYKLVFKKNKILWEQSKYVEEHFNNIEQWMDSILFDGKKKNDLFINFIYNNLKMSNGKNKFHAIRDFLCKICTGFYFLSAYLKEKNFLLTKIGLTVRLFSFINANLDILNSFIPLVCEQQDVMEIEDDNNDDDNNDNDDDDEKDVTSMNEITKSFPNKNPNEKLFILEMVRAMQSVYGLKIVGKTSFHKKYVVFDVPSKISFKKQQSEIKKKQKQKNDKLSAYEKLWISTDKLFIQVRKSINYIDNHFINDIWIDYNKKKCFIRFIKSENIPKTVYVAVSFIVHKNVKDDSEYTMQTHVIVNDVSAFEKYPKTLSKTDDKTEVKLHSEIESVIDVLALQYWMFHQESQIVQEKNEVTDSLKSNTLLIKNILEKANEKCKCHKIIELIKPNQDTQTLNNKPRLELIKKHKENEQFTHDELLFMNFVEKIFQ